MRKARLLVTKDCYRNCPLCCNKYKSIMKGIKPITTEELLVAGYEEIMITGGEPQMILPELEMLMLKLQKLRREKTAKIFMYTTMWRRNTGPWLANWLDGIHYTLHHTDDQIIKERDRIMFVRMQGDLLEKPYAYDKKSVRLYVDPAIREPITIYPHLWSRMEIKPWILEKDLELPEGEELLLWEK